MMHLQISENKNLKDYHFVYFYVDPGRVYWVGFDILSTLVSMFTKRWKINSIEGPQ